MRSASRRWVTVAAIAVAAFAPAAAHASDDFTIYDSRSQFELALGGSHTTTPGASGAGFATSATGTLFGSTITAPTTYAAGAAGNLFGSSAESIGYSFTPGVLGGMGSLEMTLPAGESAFGFDYAYNPTEAGEGVTFQGQFCNSFFGCHEYAWSGLSGGSGFIGVIAAADLAGGVITGTANNLQVANLTFAGSVTATPEPATVALMTTGLMALAGMGAARRRRSEG